MTPSLLMVRRRPPGYAGDPNLEEAEPVLVYGEAPKIALLVLDDGTELVFDARELRAALERKVAA